MTESSPASSPKAFKEPISLRRLLSQLLSLVSPFGDCKITCIGSPFPYLNNCKGEVHFAAQKLSDACNLIREFESLDGSPSRPQKFVGRLEELAKTFSCQKHSKNRNDFAYHWLAETSLPRILEHMGLKKDVATWTCLCSDNDRTCLPLKCLPSHSGHHRIYSFLNKFAVGGRYRDEAFPELMKHWLCDDHKAKAKDLTEQLKAKLLMHTQDKDISFKTGQAGEGEILHHPRETEQKPQGKADGEPTVTPDSSDDSYDPSTPTVPNKRRRRSPQLCTAAVAPSRAGECTSPNTRPTGFGQSASEREVPRTKGTEATSSSIDRRSASMPGLKPQDFGKNKKLVSSPLYGRSSLRREISHTYSTSEDDTLEGDQPLRDAVPNEPDGKLQEKNSALAEPDASVSDSGPPGKRGRISTRPSPSRNPSDRHEEEPVFPKWAEKNAPISRAGIVTVLCTSMLENALTADKGTDDGWIYIFRSPDFPGFLKIGRTTNDIRVRKRQIESKCKVYELELVEEIECFRKVSYHHRVERLIHEDLGNERRKFTCKCKKPNKKHDSTFNDDSQTEHGEWFAIDETLAKEVVKKWKDYMRLKPYSEDGTLNEEMREKIDLWQRAPEKFDSYRADGELDHRLSPLLQEFSPSTRCTFWIRRQLFKPRSELPSRWKSMQQYWKENFIFFVFHCLASLATCCCWANWPWVLSLLLIAVFPIISIWYAA